MKKIMMVAVAGMLVFSATACTSDSDEPKPIVAETIEGGYITPQDPSKDPAPIAAGTATPNPNGISGMGQGPDTSKPVEAPVEADTHELIVPNADTLKVKAGDKVNVSFFEGKPDKTYTAEIFYSTTTSAVKSQKLGAFTPDELGTVKGQVTVPANYEPGLYTLTFTVDDEILGGNIEVG